jgi:hypothetical protein
MKKLGVDSKKKCFYVKVLSVGHMLNQLKTIFIPRIIYLTPRFDGVTY